MGFICFCFFCPRSFVSFLLHLLDLGDRSKKILLQLMLKSVLPIFSSRSFIVSSLTFKSLIHFEFIFAYGVRTCFNFILLRIDVQFSQQHLLKSLSSLCCIFLPLLL